MAGIHVLPLLLLLTFVTGAPNPSSMSSDDFDMADDYDTKYIQETLPKYEPDSLSAEDYDGHPFLVHIVSDSKAESTPKPTTEGNDTKDYSAMKNALKEIDLLSELLDLKDEYLDSRQNEDPNWLSSLLYKMKTSSASEDDVNKFESDIYELLSTFVIMKTMEERLVLVNKYVESALEKDPDADLTSLLGLANKDELPEELFNLKFDQALLHAANSFISEALPKDKNLFENVKNLVDSPPEPVHEAAVIDGLVIPLPENGKINSNNNTDPSTVIFGEDDLGIVPFLFLLFASTGFLAVLFVIFYALLKCLKQCQDMNVGGNGKKRSKYEQI